MSDINPRDRLVAELDRAARTRAQGRGEPRLEERRRAFRLWQADRLGRTHADLLASARFREAALFFLTDLYGPEDLSRHAEDVRRILPLMAKTLPDPALETVADAMELDALSEELDAAMIERLGSRAVALTPHVYGDAYREVGRRADRTRQIDLIDHLGRSLDALTRQRFIGSALRMMRKPAEVAGLGALQSFLERGYGAFRTMRGASDFVDLVVARERAVSDALFAGDDEPLM